MPDQLLTISAITIAALLAVGIGHYVLAYRAVRQAANDTRALPDDRSFRELADAMPMIVWTATPDGQVEYFSRDLMEYTGVSEAHLIARQGWLNLLHVNDRDRIFGLWRKSVARGQMYEAEFRIRRHDGEYQWHLVRGVPIRDAAGELASWYGTAANIHSRKLLEEEASNLARRLTLTLESITDAFFMLDHDWCFTFLNRHCEHLLRRKRDDLIGKSVWQEFPEAVGTEIETVYRQAMNTGESVELQTYYPPLEATFDIRAFPYEEGLAVYFQDISDRLQLEAQLRQSQQLESIGQLTGGVAHDFNNLLTVIQGNAELLQEAVTDPQLDSLAEMISNAAQRGAELTQRLLAFARRQVLEPRSVDTNELIAGMDELLRRTLGEHIEIEMVRAAGLWRAMVDPVQLESALLNLCLNARDAMPHGGRLTVETANARLDRDYAEHHAEVQPGQYVLVAVSDTGHGVAPEHLSRVFEPFFTTKEKSKGTGLGLSMVYGFIKQSRGHVAIYSEPGQGTTVKMYLPRVMGEAAKNEESDERVAHAGGTETIVLVEDDDLVRRFAEGQLLALGYQVISAGNGPDALDLIRGRDDIDLLFTDVIMPGGMTGRQLADEARALRPGLKVLYTSGYTENAIVHHGRLDAGVHLLAKPYRRGDLAAALRAALNGEPE
jgi:PAS domain S-box-containing protein